MERDPCLPTSQPASTEAGNVTQDEDIYVGEELTVHTTIITLEGSGFSVADAPKPPVKKIGRDKDIFKKAWNDKFNCSKSLTIKCFHVFIWNIPSLDYQQFSRKQFSKLNSQRLVHCIKFQKSRSFRVKGHFKERFDQFSSKKTTILLFWKKLRSWQKLRQTRWPKQQDASFIESWVLRRNCIFRKWGLLTKMSIFSKDNGRIALKSCMKVRETELEQLNLNKSGSSKTSFFQKVKNKMRYSSQHKVKQSTNRE